MLWFRVFREVCPLPAAILVNRLQTFLSLLGVMVGIFVISAVFAGDSLEKELKDTFSMIDDDVLFIAKYLGVWRRLSVVEVRSTTGAHRARLGC